MILKSRHLLFMILLLPFSAVIVVGQSNPPGTPQTNTGLGLAGIFIAYWICNRRKLYPIGGWLLYFYFQLFIGALITFILSFMVFKNFNPYLWEDKTLYSLYLLSTLPAYLVTLGEVTIGGMLLLPRFRNARTVNILKTVFVVSFVSGAIGLLIDSVHWPESVVLDFLPVVASAFWFLYFTRSKRVEMVLEQNTWDPKIMYPLNVLKI